MIDSIAAVDRAWTKWANRHRLDPAAVVPQIHGRRAIDSLRLLSPDPNLDLVEEEKWLACVEETDTEGIVPIAGALEFVSLIPKELWSVVTSGTSPVAIARMAAVGLNPLSAVYGEEVANGKPSPDPYVLGAERLNVQREHCIVFEDTTAGIRSGRAAGMRVIAISGEADRPDLDEADLVIRDYRGLHLRAAKDGLTIEFGSK